MSKNSCLTSVTWLGFSKPAIRIFGSFGFSGLIDNEYSWLYAPEQALGLRLTGQLQLCSMIEMLIANEFSIISANT